MPKKISVKDQILLTEAYRRMNNFSTTWSGLGFPSQYKSRFFKPAYYPITPRVQSWWVLTERGEAAIACMNEQVTWDKHGMSRKIFTGWEPPFDWEKIAEKVNDENIS